MEAIFIPVELSGGPMDGHTDVVPQREIDVFDVFLFERRNAVERLRCAYRWANRSTAKGRRWVLEFECEVSRWPVGQISNSPKTI